MIEKIQKQILFEEAARKGIVGSKISQIPNIFKNMLGVSDINSQKYGLPLAPIYTASAGEIIDIGKFQNFFVGLSRDIKVSSSSLNELENNLSLLNLEIWSRMQILKNRANNLAKIASSEKIRAALGAIWRYTESFNDTKYLDTENTTAWIDTAEGIAFLPNLGDEKNIPMQSIAVQESNKPELGDFLGSTPADAIDGLDSSNWRCLFVKPDTWAKSTYKLPNPNDITSISIDPVGFGIEISIEATSSEGTKEIIKDIIYSKKTLVVSVKQATHLKVSFRPATSVLPKVVGIREIVFYHSKSINSSEIVFKKFKPSDPFSEIKITTSGQFPQDTKISAFFRTATGNPWSKLINNDWNSVYPTDTTSLGILYTEAVPNTSTINFKGLFAKAINISSTPISNLNGTLEIGQNMIEVSAFKKDWIEEGEFPKILSLEDFSSRPLKRTWSHVPIRAYSSSGTGTVLQLYGETSISSDSSLTRGGDYLVFQRKLDSNVYPLNISTYNQMNIVPLVGARASGSMQFNYNYKFSFKVYAPKAFSYHDARYWFYQGYRLPNRRLYSDIGKSFGTFALYINKTLITAESIPLTISTDNKIEGKSLSVLDLGKSFSMSFNEGWNTVDILMNVYDPESYGTDAFDVQDKPYLQLSLYPSLFDISLTQSSEYYISNILATGKFSPVSEFDLLWNLPKEPIFWSWSSDRQFVLFNTNELRFIDGYFKGTAPASLLTYKSIQTSMVDDLYIKLLLERNNSSINTPILDECNFMVR